MLLKLRENKSFSYSQILNDIDLNDDNIYDNHDQILISEWVDSDAKLYYSYIQFINTNQTPEELIYILKRTNNRINTYQEVALYDYYYIFLFYKKKSSVKSKKVATLATSLLSNNMSPKKVATK